MENKNVVVAVVLMLVVWLGFSFLYPPQQPAIVNSEAPAQLASSSNLPQSSMSTVPSSVIPVAETDGVRAPIRDLVVETEKYRAVFSSVGAKLKSFELREYRVSAESDAPNVVIIESPEERHATLRTTGQEGFSFPEDSFFTISTDVDSFKISSEESKQVVFTATTSGGLKIEKIFVFYGNRYDFDCHLRVTNTSTLPVSGNVQVSLVHPWDDSQEGGQLEFVGPATFVGDKLNTDEVSDLAKEPRTYGQDFVWSAFQNKYFIKAIVPLESSAQKVMIVKNDDVVENIVVSPSKSLQPGDSFNLKYLVYFGPKDLDILKVVDHQLNRAVDFGFFAPIARPLLYVLKFFYSYIGNYGVAIILLTTIIKALFWPLTQKSYTSMKAMQKLQPEMLRIKEKYKNDRERLNRETMELYKNNRVNPLGGCLPMLVQIPVFFALYKVLLDAIELRHAPFVFWLTDLSAKDPYYITPVVMGATMFIQQKMTPTNMDPMQAKVFLIMPVVFTFLFLNFPSGLVLYWLVNNVLTILQQFFINRKP